MLQGTHKIIEIGKHIKDSWPLFYVDISIRGKFPYGDLKWFNGLARVDFRSNVIQITFNNFCLNMLDIAS